MVVKKEEPFSLESFRLVLLEFVLSQLRMYAIRPRIRRHGLSWEDDGDWDYHQGLDSGPFDGFVFFNFVKFCFPQYFERIKTGEFLKEVDYEAIVMRWNELPDGLAQEFADQFEEDIVQDDFGSHSKTWSWEARVFINISSKP